MSAVFGFQPDNRIGELDYKGMRLRRDDAAVARASTEKERWLAGHKEKGKKKDTPAPLWAGAYTRRMSSERRQTGWRSHQSDTS
jgi:hypothetical protein